MAIISRMNRSEGLVQRRNVSQAGSGQGRTDDPLRDSDDERTGSKDDDSKDEDHDSKETRLTLMEEVLLLGLKDKEVP